MSSLLLAVGCAASAEPDEPAPDAVSVSAQVVGVEPPTADGSDVCSLLPSCGPCSLACDPEKLAEQYVPKGACALFQCMLSDGRTIRVDACNYGDG